MQTIKKDDYERTPSRSLGAAIEKGGAAKKRLTRSILNNTGIFVGFFLIFVVIVVFTTEIKITSVEFWAQLGLTFFILLFCSYSMYVNCSDSGLKAGRVSDTYQDCKNEYEGLKAQIIERKYQSRLTEFCRYYIDRELKETRTNILSEVGISYEKYIEKYVGKDKKLLQADENLSKAQIKAIIKANQTKPVNLTPEMIFKRGRGNGHRSPLGIKPETKRSVHYVAKFIRTTITSLLTGVIVLDVIKYPTWATFAACCLKLLPVILNGFMGYRMGYENITVDTVNYMQDQKDLMQQLIEYASTTPEPQPEQVIEDEVIIAPEVAVAAETI